jgi:hypothetical protein
MVAPKGRVPGPFLRDGPAGVPCLRSLTAILASVGDLLDPLPASKGGTNSQALPAAGGVCYGNNTQILVTPAGSSGQYLKSNGAYAPTWADFPAEPAPTAGGVNYGTGSAQAYTAAGSAGQLLKSNGAAAPSWVDAGANDALTVSMLEADVTSDSDAAARVFDDWVWRLVQDDVLSLHFQLAVLGTSVCAPRIGLFTDVVGEWPAANGSFRTLTFANSTTTPAWAHSLLGSLTGAVTSSVPATITIWNLDAVLTMPAEVGEIELRLASSVDEVAVRILAGSFVEYRRYSPV